MDINKYVGSKIKEYRKKKGMNQTELGKKLGVAQNTVAGYEKGEWEVSYDNLFKIAEIFDISIDDLFPATKNDNEYKALQNASKVAETKDLDYDDMILIKKITEKALSLESDKRKELMDNIKFAVDFFEKKD
ncbi:helix-turn-helix domain-containing protein [Ornithinibacillus salinisoli]|uniref:Helix-turn-helix domain-containing protein n=1 Tax=Ornithinibacillus salinisoli TaxID=1848459 RepID=A0ABW4W5G1_9BACI